MKKNIIFIKDNQTLGEKAPEIVIEEYPSLANLPSEVARFIIEQKKVVFKAISACMYPIILPGDLLHVIPVKADDIKEGDVALYSRQARLYAHKIFRKLEKEGKRFFLTGSQKQYEKGVYTGLEEISEDDILGKIIFVQRRGVKKSCILPSISKIDKISIFFKRFIWNKMEYCKESAAEILLKVQKFRIYRKIVKFLFKPYLNFFIGKCVFDNKNKQGVLSEYVLFENFIADFKPNSKYIICAKIKGMPVGSVFVNFSVFANKKEAVGCDLYVRRPYRGLGVGTGLVKSVLQLCEKMTVETVSFKLMYHNEPALNMFKKLGFEIL